jgi:hypothetical protein
MEYNMSNVINFETHRRFAIERAEFGFTYAEYMATIVDTAYKVKAFKTTQPQLDFVCAVAILTDDSMLLSKENKPGLIKHSTMGYMFETIIKDGVKMYPDLDYEVVYRFAALLVLEDDVEQVLERIEGGFFDSKQDALDLYCQLAELHQ